ncbi:MAG: glycosyltransferase [Anaerolineae bacterium]
MSAPTVSIIVITYQRGEELGRCLHSLAGQTGLPTPVEVILVDNAGDAVVDWDDIPDFTLRVLRPGENLGVAGGRNLGISLAQGEILLFIDDDAEWLTPTTARETVELLNSDQTIGAVALRSIRPSGETIIGELPHPDKERLQGTEGLVEVPYYYGVAHALRASSLVHTGLYPERFFYAMEEYDLSLRLYDAGYRIVYDPNLAVIHHHAQAGRPVTGKRYWVNNARNKIRVGWRLLPLLYALSISLVWGARVLQKTHSVRAWFDIYRSLWDERQLLRHERKPIQWSTVKRLRSIGARLVY